MRIAQISDIHYAPETLVEVDRCFSYAIDQAIARNCQAAILSGDLFDHRLDLHSPAVAHVLMRVRDLADAMPVLILQGTFSHDAPGSLDVFKTLGGNFQVCVADRIQQVALVRHAAPPVWNQSAGAAFTTIPPEAELLVSCLPSVNKGAVAALVGAEAAAEAVGDHVLSLLRSWAPPNLAARAAEVPTVVTAHGTVSGCITEHGVPMAGLDHEFTTGALFAAEASACMLGHIHQHQEWERDGRRIAYPGSIGRLHFGELADKGFLIWEVDTVQATAEFVVTPAKRLIQIEFDGPPDMAHLSEAAASAAGAHVRIRFAIDEEHRHSVDKDAIRALFAAAIECKIEGRINPIQRSRSAGISRAVSLSEKLWKWCETTNTEPAPLTERLLLLEHQAPEQIVQMTLECAG